MISQPRIAVLGLSQLYIFIDFAYWLLVVVVLGFELYLQFKLQFKPSAYLYLRTSMGTRIAILVFFNDYSSSISSLTIRLPRGLVADDFGYEMPGQRQKRVSLNVVESFQAQRGDKSHATLQTMMETAHSLLFPCAGDWAALRSHQGSDGSQEDKLSKLWTLQEGLYTTCTYVMTHPRVI